MKISVIGIGVMGEPIARATRDLFGQAIRRGQGNDDAIGIVKVLRDKAAS
jgi:hypothetical protein